MQAFMANVLLPISTAQQVAKLQRALMDDFHISVVFGMVRGRDNEEIHFVRLSAQVYLALSDFQFLAIAVATILQL
jgi:hypothetical protein